MKKTLSFTYLFIESQGRVTENGFIANEDGIFDPDEITKTLDIKPFKSWKSGDLRQDGSSYSFSSWAAGKSIMDGADVEAQCLETIQYFKNKIPQLQLIKKQYEVTLGIMIVPSIFHNEPPIISLNEKVIQFCYETDCSIEVDMYIYDEE